MTDSRLGSRVASAAAAVLASQKGITTLDVLCGIGWLHSTHVDS